MEVSLHMQKKAPVQRGIIQFKPMKTYQIGEKALKPLSNPPGTH